MLSIREDYPPPLPVHGFVLAGGGSSRMGRDKALLEFRGRPMVEIAVEKLRSFCVEVAIAGNREDLLRFAPVIQETRRDSGPVAGVEAGLRACQAPWALFLPVDVPLVPAALLRMWAERVLAQAESGCGCSFLRVAGREQPAFCLLRRVDLPVIEEAVENGERRLRNLLWALGQGKDDRRLWICDVEKEAAAWLDPQHPQLQVSRWFRNLNTPEDLREAQVGVEPE